MTKKIENNTKLWFIIAGVGGAAIIAYLIFSSKKSQSQIPNNQTGNDVNNQASQGNNSGDSSTGSSTNTSANNNSIPTTTASSGANIKIIRYPVLYLAAWGGNQPQTQFTEVSVPNISVFSKSDRVRLTLPLYQNKILQIVDIWKSGDSDGHGSLKLDAVFKGKSIINYPDAGLLEVIKTVTV